MTYSLLPQRIYTNLNCFIQSINQYSLLQTQEKSKTYYAAKILRHEGRSTVLKWFDCNKYSPMRDKPLTDEFKLPTQRAVEAAIAMYDNAENVRV